MVRPTASTERIAAGRLPPTESDSATAATVPSEATKPASGPPFRPRCADAEIATKSAVNSECWSWEELGAPALQIPAGTRADSMSGADAAASADGQQAAPVEARVDADCGEAVDASAADITEDSPVASAAEGLCANIEDTTMSDDSHQQMQVQSAPAPAPPIQTNSLSLAERQRLQREAQQAFLRSRGIIASASSSGGQNAAASPKGGAGAAAPAAREGFVAHRDVSGKIANLRNAVQKKTSGVGARSAAGSGTTISRTGSNVSASNDSPTGTCSSTANATASTEQHGKDDSISEATSYPPYPAYPQTMIALGYKLGDPRDKKGGTGGATVDDAVSSMLKGARKAGVAVTGGAMVAVGAVLTPLPTPGGILIAGAGLGVLSTEFEGAKKVMDKGRDKLVDLIDSIDDDKKENEEAIAEGDDENEDEDESKEISDDAEANEKDEVVSDAGTSSAGCSRRSSETSQKAAADLKPIPAPASSTSASSFRNGLSRIGKSIRPLLTDDEAPRRAMDELKTKSERRMSEMKSSTQRTYMKMRSHLNTVVDQLALPDNEALGHHDFAASSDAAGSSKPAASDGVKAEKAPMASLEGKDTCGDSSVPGNDTLR